MTDEEIERKIKALSKQAVRLRASPKRLRLRFIALGLYNQIKNPIMPFNAWYGELDDTL